MLNYIYPLIILYIFSELTSKKLHYYHSDEIHPTKYIEEGNYSRMKCYYAVLERYQCIF